MKKLKKTISIAIFVSLAAQIKFDFITDGFIIALSVLVMAIFIYCYEDLSPKYIAFCSGIFSPLFRLIITFIEEGESIHTVALVIPDMVFFFSYGIIYTLVYKYLIWEPKSIRNFPIALLICDVLSNIMELIARGMIHQENLITAEIVTYLLLIALCRTILIQMILLAMEAYSSLLIKKEHDEEYKRLIVQASVLESEIHVMDKNATEIEEIMKKAFTLYQEMKKLDIPIELQEASLDISKTAHEIKGDYRNIVNILKETFVDQYDESGIPIGDIVSIEKSNLQNLLRNKNWEIEIYTRIKVDFYVKQYFKMMSVIRNLMLNAAESIGETGGKIGVMIKEEGDNYIIKVRDNGQGIKKEKLDSIFFEGYSTKFNLETGNIQRGLGLSLVKEFVENYFKGEISVSSEKNKKTEFVLTMPKSVFAEGYNEILHS